MFFLFVSSAFQWSFQLDVVRREAFSWIPLETNVFLPLVQPLSASLAVLSTLLGLQSDLPCLSFAISFCLAAASSRADRGFAFPLAQSLPQRILGVGLFTRQTLTWTPGGLGMTGWDGYLSSELCPASGPWARMRLYHFPMPKIPRPLRSPPDSGSSWFSGFLGFILNTGEFQRRLRDTWKSFTSAFLFLMWVSCWASSPFPGETCPKTYPQWMSHFVQYFLCVWSSSCWGMVIQYRKYFWT